MQEAQAKRKKKQERKKQQIEEKRQEIRKSLPVGGIKEKVLAAKRAGVTRIILPAKNEKDLRDLPEHVKAALTFHFVSEIDEVVRAIWGDAQFKMIRPPDRGEIRDEAVAVS